MGYGEEGEQEDIIFTAQPLYLLNFISFACIIYSNKLITLYTDNEGECCPEQNTTVCLYEDRAKGYSPEPLRTGFL